MPGLTVDASAAIAIGNTLHIVVRGLDGSSLLHSMLNLETMSLSGWTSLNGLSDTPNLSTDGDLWMNTYDGSWTGWQPLPGGLINVGPAVMAYNNKLMAMVKDVSVSFNVSNPYLIVTIPDRNIEPTILEDCARSTRC